MNHEDNTCTASSRMLGSWGCLWWLGCENQSMMMDEDCNSDNNYQGGEVGSCLASLALPASTTTTTGVLLVVLLFCVILIIELAFWCLVYKRYLVPKANERRPAAQYRAPYDTHKHLLLRKIVRRICTDAAAANNNNNNNNSAMTSSATNSDIFGETTTKIRKRSHSSQTDQQEQERQVFCTFLTSWFREVTVPITPKMMEDINSSSKNKNPNARVQQLTATTNPRQRRYQKQTDSPTQEFDLTNRGNDYIDCTIENDDDDDDVGSICSTTGSSSEDTSGCNNNNNKQNQSTTTTTTKRQNRRPSKGQSSAVLFHSATTATEQDINATTTPSASWTIPGLHRPEMDDFIAWAFFAKDMTDMDEADLVELHNCYDELSNTLQLSVSSGKDDDDDASISLTASVTISKECQTNLSASLSVQDATQDDCKNEANIPTHPPLLHKTKLVPRRLSLDDAQPWHRPLAVYLVVYFLQHVVAGLILRLAGFVRVVSPTTGLTGWVRGGGKNSGAREKTNAPIATLDSGEAVLQNMPLIFFHGIAPAGVLFYLPMLLFGLLKNDNRPCLLVDHPNISCNLAFHVLSEQETVTGVEELVEIAGWSDPNIALTVCGHSFGSCPISWLLHNPHFRPRVRLCILLDPVTLLLSDPAVMINFLYSREVSNISVIASSELFTEYYLRRHFSWYNSEMWLDEVMAPTPSSTVEDKGDTGSNIDDTSNRRTPSFQPLHVIVALSEHDEIVDAPKVKRHMDLFLERQALSQQHTLQEQSQSQQLQHLNCTDNSSSNNNNSSMGRLRTIYWTDAKHASCVKDPRKWRDIRTAMLQSEHTVQDSTTTIAATVGQ